MALGLYLHVPFCQSICSYCNFNRGLFDADLAEQYVHALATEIERASSGEPADTIFFGGGTPSILLPSDIGRLIRSCRSAFDVSAEAEVTLETNPETVTDERMAGWRDAGVTRVSLGAQSFDAAELRRLDRAHTPARVGEAVGSARAAGFTNISLDLMFWLPGQSRASWRQSLDRALDLGPDHLSLYLLELYPNAPLREAMARRRSEASPSADWVQAADDEAADMYLEAFERLESVGMRQYEISNAARNGAVSRHNLKYWTSGSWHGFGCGAHSTVSGRRWHNIAPTREYIERIAAGRAVHDEEHQLSADQRAEEAIFTGLRLVDGIDRAVFSERFGFDPWTRHRAVLEGPEGDGLIWRSHAAFGLTRKGMLVSNEIAALVIE